MLVPAKPKENLNSWNQKIITRKPDKHSDSSKFRKISIFPISIPKKCRDISSFQDNNDNFYFKNQTGKKFQKIKTKNYPSTYLLKQAEIKENFIKLANQWRIETKHMSLMSDIISHTAYQQIIGMGKDAIPLILEELSKEPEHWFWALRCITRVNPIKQEDRGRIKKMATAWLNWGRQHGYRC